MNNLFNKRSLKDLLENDLGLFLDNFCFFVKVYVRKIAIRCKSSL